MKLLKDFEKTSNAKTQRRKVKDQANRLKSKVFSWRLPQHWIVGTGPLLGVGVLALAVFGGF